MRADSTQETLVTHNVCNPRKLVTSVVRGTGVTALNQRVAHTYETLVLVTSFLASAIKDININIWIHKCFLII